MDVASTHRPAASSPISRWPLAALLGFALVVRGGILAVQFDQLRADPDGYRQFAFDLLRDGIRQFPSAYRPPLYPLVLTLCLQSPGDPRWSIVLLHLACGLLTVWLAVRLAARCGLGRWSLLAGGLVACDPILLHHSTLIMTETLATLLAVVSLSALTRASERSSALAVGMAAGCLTLAALCRPVFLVTLLFCWLPLVLREKTWLRRGAAALAYFVGAAVVVAPWTVRNQWLLESPILTTTHGGYTLHLGNNARFYEHLREAQWGDVWQIEKFDRTLYGPDWWEFRGGMYPPERAERFLDRWHYERAWSAIKAEPGMFAYACLMRNAYLWQLVPHRVDGDESTARQMLRYGVGLWYLAEFMLALAGIWSLGRKLFHSPWLWGLLLCASVMLVHTFYWTNMRMRAPLMPVVAMLAAAGAAWLWEMRRR